MNDLQKTIEELEAMLDNFASPAVSLQHNFDLGTFFNIRENIEYKIEELKSIINERLKNPEPLLKFANNYLTTQIFGSIKLSSALFKMINTVQQMPKLPCIPYKESLDFSDKSAWRNLSCSTLKQWLLRADIYVSIDNDFRNKLKNFRGNVVKINKRIVESIERTGFKTSVGAEKNISQQIQNFSFVKDSKLKAILERDFKNIMCCLASDRWKDAIILCGSSIEALLYSVLTTNNEIIESFIPADKKIEDLSLMQLINVASRANFITTGVEKFSHSLRDYRNLVHPIKELKGSYMLDEPEARASFAVLEMVIRDIKDFLNKRSNEKIS